MTKKFHAVWIVGSLTVVALSLVAATYAVTKLPEEAFVQQLKIHQMDFSSESTFDGALTAVQLQEEAFFSKEIHFTSERGELPLTPVELGASSQNEALNSYLSGFMEDTSGLEKIQVYFFGKTLDFPLSVDEEKMKLAFTDTGIEQGVKNAQFLFDGTVKIDPEQIGYGVDTEAIALQLQDYWANNFQVPSDADLPLRTAEPDIRDAQLEALLPAAQTQAERTFTLTDEFSDSWDFSMAEHITLLIPGTDTIFKIDEQAFITAIELELVPEVEQDPLPVIITENEEGGFDFHGSARFGREIDKTTLLTELEIAVNLTLASSAEPSGSDILSLPILQVDPQVTVPQSLKDKGVTELLGFGYSTFNSSPSNRISNVNHGFELFNGTIVEKDTEFSFTTLMGHIDAANGWLPELVIKGDETIPEYGGGICQVSSTMFRAALYTGLPITARTNHSYAVSYYATPYGYGLDATVYEPNPDLKFMNDTPGAILVQGYTEGDDAYFVFYGTNDHRTVTMEGPTYYDYRSTAEVKTEYTDALPPGVRELEEYAHTGFKVDWYRTVLYPEGSPSTFASTASGVRENIHSDYQTRPAKYLEGKPEAAPTEEPSS